MGNPQFDLIAEEYDESLPAHVVEHYLRKRTAFLIEQCPSGEGLDVGCGTGVLAERLAQRGLTMTGLDPSAGMLEVMREKRPVWTPSQGSGTALPFADDSFDLVMCVAVMHHVAEPQAVRSDPRGDGAGRPPRRSCRGVGPQPAQPVLEEPDGAGAAGHGRGTADR